MIKSGTMCLKLKLRGDYFNSALFKIDLEKVRNCV